MAFFRVIQRDCHDLPIKTEESDEEIETAITSDEVVEEDEVVEHDFTLQ